MDELVKQGQWWWLILPAVLALFGSWLGAKLGKTNEHEQWLRNQKVEKYTAYVNACKHIVRVTNGTAPDPERFNESWTTLGLIDAELVASKKVQARLDGFDRAFFNYATSKGDPEVLEEKYTQALEDLNKAFRKDLRIRD